MQYLWIGFGGFLGANARYLVQRWAAGVWGPEFPYGTMLANVTGSLVIAFFLSLVTSHINIPEGLRLFVMVGFLGGFTTFSSFSMETYMLADRGSLLSAALYFMGNTGLGLVGVLVGVGLGRLVV